MTAGAGLITSLEAWPVNVPLDAPYEFATGVYAGVSSTVARVSTDTGLVGLGESPSPADAVDLWEQAGDVTGRDAASLLERFASVPFTKPAARDTPEMTVRSPQVALEMALWDIAAQAANQPLCELLGNPVRREIELTEYFAFRVPGPGAEGERTAAEVAAYCARMVREHDSPVFEGKMGVRPPAEEIRMLREVRAAIGPERRLRVDANMAWTPETAGATLEQLEQLGVEYVEEPVAGLAAMAALRRSTSIPISAHSTDIPAAAELGAPDALVLSIAGCGGVGPTLRFAAECARAGVDFRFYSGDLGIATAAQLHVAAVLESVTGPHQTLLRWYHDDVITGGPLRPHRGRLPVPAATPGLGVDLDLDALHRGVARFESDGEYDYYGGPPLPRF